MRPTWVKIGGFAFTDTDVDGVPDAIETLKDIVDNNKKVQMTVLGQVRTGSLEGYPVHTEGGWAMKYNWSVKIVLDP